VNQNFQPGTHPDADQLNTFVEGVATPREREQMLAHLSECAECRETIFLMQKLIETPAAVNEVSPNRPWRRWFLPAGLAGAALACGISLMLLYIMPNNGTDRNRQVAGVRVPEIQANSNSAPLNSSAPANTQTQEISPKQSAAETPQTLARPASSKVPKTEALPEVAGAIKQGSALDETGRSFAARAVISPAPVQPLQAGASPAAASEIPLNGRNVTNVQTLAAPPRAEAAAPQDSSSAKANLPGLKIEQDRGQVDTLSGVSGHVMDASGAVVPAATVTLRDAVGSTRQIPTSADGSFQLSNIPAGHYDLTVTARGFKSNTQPIDLKPSQLATLQPVLSVGTATETVEVTSTAPLLQTESASISSIPVTLPSRLPTATSVAFGNRILSLDSSGNLFLSRNAGKSWKKVKPQWAGKAVGVTVQPPETLKAENSKTSTAETPGTVFQLTTDAGAVWVSQDGTRWHSK
jgi:hypothetical protein